jgi:hypothetical protein
MPFETSLSEVSATAHVILAAEQLCERTIQLVAGGTLSIYQLAMAKFGFGLSNIDGFDAFHRDMC